MSDVGNVQRGKCATTHTPCTNRFIVERVGQREYPVRSVEVEHRVGPARQDDVGRRPRRCSVSDDGDERLDAADHDAGRRVLGHVEHIERQSELNYVIVRLVSSDVDDDARTVLTVSGTDAQRVDGRRRAVQSTRHLQHACTNTSTISLACFFVIYALHG